ncbi:hypothetical protein [Evansella cellulosilytica]|uniref:Uncharacterized protein n=1 Tax=Evansella cellulosilytica (strain ATCC 21833 / DSM 2522 / FERM P-1141 / JCM 9156 / N-4) TaxID=649639 RepID=E6TW23_EVAC2|nr:hypothetical protein [Evansella cellulosilytica]ADU29846.1 hypothetical protein Bcell_1583 [Evansella cellulosilytica DSM 2522]
MAHLLSRGLLFVAILMFGFIFGVVYSNHATVESQLIENEPTEKREEKASVPSPGFILNDEKKDSSDDLKIEMEDEEGIVIYGDGEDVLQELRSDVDIERDLLDKQQFAQKNGHNFFSEMGIRTADTLEGVFRSLFSVIE